MDSPSRRPTPVFLERLVVAHLAIFVIMATWMFGGRIYWAYIPLLTWGLIGAALTVFLWIRTKERRLRHALCLLPLLLLISQMLASMANPSFGEFAFYDQQVLRPIDHLAWAPSSAYPASTLSDLGLYAGLYLSAYNLFLGVRTRRALRVFAIIALVNGGILAVFGTVQKLVGADIFFGLQKSPNPAFFASFIYHNHWGAFAILTASLGLAVVAHFIRRQTLQDLMHSPAISLTLPVLLLALSIPLSTSRSSTLLGLLLAGMTLGYVFRLLRRHSRGSPWRRVQLNIGVTLTVALVASAGYFLAKPIIQQRLQDTVRQVHKKEHYALLKSHQIFYGQARLILYRDTWRMIADKPAFGWGFGCYGKVFMRYNSQSSTIDRVRSPYLDAHSDWLESLAELGWIGTGLVLGLAAGPLWLARRMIMRRAESGFALLGVTLIAGYAAIEFPFANPAVVLTFWCTFFYAVRTAQITEMNLGT